MRPHPGSPLDDFDEVERYAESLLRKAGVRGDAPTPVDEIVETADLVIAQDVDLGDVSVELVKKAGSAVRRAFSKLLGMVDLRTKTIYLDLGVLPAKRGFIKLHETGHKVLPWQKDTYLCLDDETTLSPEIHEVYERQANHFASTVLFQGGRFDQEARELPLALKSAMHLAKRFGASVHATLRRFVERNHRACALLVLERLQVPEQSTGSVLRTKTVVESKRWMRWCGEVDWPEYLTEDFPATAPVLRKRKFMEDGQLVLSYSDGEHIECVFHLFDNTYNPLIFIYPKMEKAATRTRIELKSIQ
jgi:hypothetical protein